MISNNPPTFSDRSDIARHLIWYTTKTHTHAHTHTHTHTQTDTDTHKHTLSLTQTHTLTLSLTHTNTHSFSLSHNTHTHTLTCWTLALKDLNQKRRLINYVIHLSGVRSTYFLLYKISFNFGFRLKVLSLCVHRKLFLKKLGKCYLM